MAMEVIVVFKESFQYAQAAQKLYAAKRQNQRTKGAKSSLLQIPIANANFN